MEWVELYPASGQPTAEAIAEYTGEAKTLWVALGEYMEKAYKSKPKYSYSGCSGKPGWNVKYQKSGQGFGTLYPEKDAFSVLLVISYKLMPALEDLLPQLSPSMAALWQEAGDYMRLGKWAMFTIRDEAGLEDYKKLIALKVPPKL